MKRKLIIFLIFYFALTNMCYGLRQPLLFEEYKMKSFDNNIVTIIKAMKLLISKLEEGETKCLVIGQLENNINRVVRIVMYHSDKLLAKTLRSNVNDIESYFNNGDYKNIQDCLDDIIKALNSFVAELEGNFMPLESKEEYISHLSRALGHRIRYSATSGRIMLYSEVSEWLEKLQNVRKEKLFREVKDSLLNEIAIINNMIVLSQNI